MLGIVLRLVIEGAVGEEGFAGGFFEQDGSLAAEEVFGFVTLFEGDEEDLALAVAPFGEEVGGREEDAGGVGEGGAEEHGGGAAVDE